MPSNHKSFNAKLKVKANLVSFPLQCWLPHGFVPVCHFAERGQGVSQVSLMHWRNDVSMWCLSNKNEMFEHES